MYKLLPYLILIVLLGGCKAKATYQPAADVPVVEEVAETPAEPVPAQVEPPEEEPEYADGLYCTSVKTHNPATGSDAYYELNAEVSDGKLVKLHWPNGGWLDESHFTAPVVSDRGYCEFTTDRSYVFQVIIKERGGCNFSQDPSDLLGGTSQEPEEDEDAKIERVYGSYKGEVYKRISGCDYMILEERGDYVVAEWMGGYDPDEGDVIQGQLHNYGTKSCYNKRRDRESRLYIEDYGLSLSRAWEIIRDKCNLREESTEDDQ